MNAKQAAERILELAGPEEKWTPLETKDGALIFANIECEWDRLILGEWLPWYDEMAEEECTLSK